MQAVKSAPTLLDVRLCSLLSVAQVFESIGPVVELVVVRDKFTHESKGSAFVWYTNKADADQVWLQLKECCWHLMLRNHSIAECGALPSFPGNALCFRSSLRVVFS